jgi:hypothetical protein
LLDLFDEGEASSSYDASSFFDDGNFGVDESDGHELESMGDSSDEGGGFDGDDDDRDGDDFGQSSEKGALYDAYNLLHSLAQVSLSINHFLVQHYTELNNMMHFVLSNRTFKNHLMHLQW